MQIKGFIHCYATERGQSILHEQLNRLYLSTLWEKTSKLYIGVIGALHSIPSHPKIEVFQSDNNTFECHTLTRLYDECCQRDCYAYYMHTKGASHIEPDTAAYSWRIIMEDIIVDQHACCIAALASGIVDSCGPLGIRSEANWPFYAGNFWWTKSDYVRTLKSPEAWGKHFIERGSEERWAYESWITQNKLSNYLFITSGHWLLDKA